MKTCKDTYVEHRAKLAEEYARFRKELEETAEKEFPNGTKVSYKMPHRKEPIIGEITGRMKDDPAWLFIRSVEGIGHTARAWDVVRLEEHDQSWK